MYDTNNPNKKATSEVIINVQRTQAIEFSQTIYAVQLPEVTPVESRLLQVFPANASVSHKILFLITRYMHVKFKCNITLKQVTQLISISLVCTDISAKGLLMEEAVMLLLVKLCTCIISMCDP